MFPTTHTSPDQPAAGVQKQRDINKECHIHKKSHLLNKCIGFRMKSIEERKNLLRELGACFKCCASTGHLFKECKHPETFKPKTVMTPNPIIRQDGEEEEVKTPTPSVTSKCTEICGDRGEGRSCSKICLVTVHPEGQLERAVRMYAIINDQSNRSLVRSEFFNLFNIQDNASPYTLRMCAGRMETTGRRVNGYIICSLDGKVKMPLPTIIECNHMAEDRSEIPIPDVARHHPHLKAIADRIPLLDESAQILLLLSRDIMRAHKIHEQLEGEHDDPCTQRLDLGWVIVGEGCIDKTSRLDKVETLRTNLLENVHLSLSQV